MTLIALLLALLIVAVGVVALVSPSGVLRIARAFESKAGLYFAAILRLVLGIALVYAASVSRAPQLLLILGVFIILAGLITPFIGVERYRRIVDWWWAKGLAFHRFWGAVAIAFGLLLAYAIRF